MGFQTFVVGFVHFSWLPGIFGHKSGCFGWLGVRTGSASVKTAPGHCSGASQVNTAPCIFPA